jgi:hypothetical protein
MTDGEKIYLIDWQTNFFGPLLIDFAFLLYGSYDPSDIFEKELIFLKYFYEKLIEKGFDSNLCSFNQFEEMYDLCLPISFI